MPHMTTGAINKNAGAWGAPAFLATATQIFILHSVPRSLMGFESDQESEWVSLLTQ